MTMNYSIETSESIQEDILTCIEGFFKGKITDIERMNDALCQIIVDRRKSAMSNEQTIK